MSRCVEAQVVTVCWYIEKARAISHIHKHTQARSVRTVPLLKRWFCETAVIAATLTVKDWNLCYCHHCQQRYWMSVTDIFGYCCTFMAKRTMQTQNSYRTLLFYIWNLFLGVLYKLKQNALCGDTFICLPVRASVCELASRNKSCVGFSWNFIGAFCKVLWSKCEFCKNWPRSFLTVVRAY